MLEEVCTKRCARIYPHASPLAPPVLPLHQSKTWTEVTCAGRLPPPRHTHIMAFHKDALYLFGGQVGRGGVGRVGLEGQLSRERVRRVME